MLNKSSVVMPVKAGIQMKQNRDAGFHRYDGGFRNRY